MKKRFPIRRRRIDYKPYLLAVLTIALAALFLKPGVTGKAAGSNGLLNNSLVNDSSEANQSATGVAEESLPVEEVVNQSGGRIASLKELEEEQLRVLTRRAELVKQKRELLDELRIADFKDKEFYQKAVDLLSAEESELALKAELLEEKIRRLKLLEENKERLAAYKKRIEELKEEVKGLVEELKGKREAVMELWSKNFSDRDLDSFLKDWERVKSEEEAVVNELRVARQELEEKERFVQELEGGGDESLVVVRRSRLLEEIEVVRNRLLEAYLEAKDLSGPALAKARVKIKDLERELGDLRLQLSKQG